MRKALYPGTFDPVTYGHLDVVQRACQLFDHVTIGVAKNNKKAPFLSQEARVRLIESNIEPFANASVVPFDGLTIDCARALGAQVIIRGLRAISDFEFEFQLAQMNRQLDEAIETIFLMPSQDYFYTSSHLIKEVSRFTTKRIEKFVPANVLKALKEHC